MFADKLAREKGWSAVTLATAPFALLAYWPSNLARSHSVTIFIEGDGFSWIGRTQPSFDPTPINPLGLRLALSHPEMNAAYLARPCQYVDEGPTPCSVAYWTEKRFSPEVVSAANDAVNRIKKRFDAQRVTLVGYSGGGAIAALIAAERNDVEALVTLAGNLDPLAWSHYHRMDILQGSLNPAERIDDLQKIRQWHFAGGKDKVIPPILIDRFAARFPENHRPAVLIEESFDHQCCWVEEWPGLWNALPVH